MKNPPVYIAHNLKLVHNLAYGWSGWPSKGLFPEQPDEEMLQVLAEKWQQDGLSLYTYKWNPEEIQVTVKATPEIAPTDIARLIKGRLDHALRQAGTPVKFSRKVTLRSLGNNTSRTVVNYVNNQLEQIDLADPRYRDMLAHNAVEDNAVDLTKPSETNSGRYWYNLHLVFVTSGRYRSNGKITLRNMREHTISVSKDTQCRIKAFSLMPDHIHIALRGNIAMSPQDIGLAFQNGLADAVGRFRYWQENFYTGTFSEYDLKALGSPLPPCAAGGGV
jgi:REP element-mobilizing transposase RayT